MKRRARRTPAVIRRREDPLPAYPVPELPPEGESSSAWEDAWEAKRSVVSSGKDLTKGPA